MILGVPTLCRYDLLDELLRSAERGHVRPSRYIIIDNGGRYPLERAVDVVRSPVERVNPYKNSGVSASWNRIMEMAGDEPVVIANDDVILSDDSIRDFEEATKELPFVAAETVGYALFAVTKECRETVGWFDENFWPAYYEDIDYNRRLMLSGMRNGAVPRPVFHGVASTRNALPPSEAAIIHDGFRSNEAYYARKWGGERGAERFTTPFNGAPPDGWKERH